MATDSGFDYDDLHDAMGVESPEDLFEGFDVPSDPTESEAIRELNRQTAEAIRGYIPDVMSRLYGVFSVFRDEAERAEAAGDDKRAAEAREAVTDVTRDAMFVHQLGLLALCYLQEEIENE